MKNIIVNADDFGANNSVNRAIIELFDAGILNSTTLMANMPGFNNAVELAHKNKITNKIGAHLVLTEGTPLTAEINTLNYLFHKGVTTRGVLVKKLFLLDRNQKQLIFNEYCAQIEKIQQEGIQIHHLDTHQHMHDMWGVLQILTELLKKYKIASIRILNNMNTTEVYKNMYRDTVNRYMKFKNINYTDYFGSKVDYLQYLSQNPNFNKGKTIEIMVHPDYNQQGELIDVYLDTNYDFNDFKGIIV